MKYIKTYERHSTNEVKIFNDFLFHNIFDIEEVKEYGNILKVIDNSNTHQLESVIKIKSKHQIDELNIIQKIYMKKYNFISYSISKGIDDDYNTTFYLKCKIHKNSYKFHRWFLDNHPDKVKLLIDMTDNEISYKIRQEYKDIFESEELGLL